MAAVRRSPSASGRCPTVRRPRRPSRSRARTATRAFPARVSATATYTLEADALRLVLQATTTKPTPINMSAHPYFNLAGAAALDVADHELEVFAGHFLPTDKQQIPHGEIRPVDGTVFDFRKPVAIGARCAPPRCPVARCARRFDHCFVLDGHAGLLRKAARLTHRGTGRVLELETDARRAAGLHRQQSRRLARRARRHLSSDRRPRAGGRGLPRCAEPAVLPLDDPCARARTFSLTILYRFSLA